jgi:hypothetical protein
MASGRCGRPALGKLDDGICMISPTRRNSRSIWRGREDILRHAGAGVYRGRSGIWKNKGLIRQGVQAFIDGRKLAAKR